MVKISFSSTMRWWSSFKHLVKQSFSSSTVQSAPEQIVFVDSTTPPPPPVCVPKLYSDPLGKIPIDRNPWPVPCLQDVKVKANEQLYCQVVRTYNPTDNALVVVVQASVVDKKYDLTTLSDLTCGDADCCKHLFDNYLHQTNLTFVHAPKEKTNKKLKFMGHKHCSNGYLQLYIDLVL